MTSVRDNGPITTLLKMSKEGATLWKNLWLNVLSKDELRCSSYDLLTEDTFPWLGKTRTSESCTTKKCPDGCERCSTFPELNNKLQQFWGMPKRIRLIMSYGETKCSCCGCLTNTWCSKVFVKNKGIRYIGGWRHSLTPYSVDKKHEKLPRALSGRAVGRGCYKNWLGLLLEDEGSRVSCSKNIESYYSIKQHYIEERHSSNLRVWVFGFDIVAGQAKSKCWYDHDFPIFSLQPQQIVKVKAWTQYMLMAAKDSADILRKHVKEAWCKEPDKVKGDIGFIDTEFWQSTEADFYKQLHVLVTASMTVELAPSTVYAKWLKTLCSSVEQLFDQFALQSSVEDLDLRRVIIARANLISKFHTLKSIKLLKEKGLLTKGVTHG